MKFVPKYPDYIKLLQKDRTESYAISKKYPELHHSSKLFYHEDYKNLQMSLVKESFELLSNKNLELSSQEVYLIRFFAAQILSLSIIRFSNDIKNVEYAQQILTLTQAILNYSKESKQTWRLKDVERFEMHANRIIDNQKIKTSITDITDAIDINDSQKEK